MPRRRWNQWKTIYVCTEHRIVNVYELDENEKLKKRFKRLKHRNLRILNDQLKINIDQDQSDDIFTPNNSEYQSPNELLLPPASNLHLQPSNQSFGIENSSTDVISKESLISNASSPNVPDIDITFNQQNQNLLLEEPLENVIQKDKNNSDQLFHLLIEDGGEYNIDYNIDCQDDDYFLNHLDD